MEYNSDLSFTAQQPGAHERLYHDRLAAFADRGSGAFEAAEASA